MREEMSGWNPCVSEMAFEPMKAKKKFGRP
jgi:hypothetical protein